MGTHHQHDRPVAAGQLLGPLSDKYGRENAAADGHGMWLFIGSTPALHLRLGHPPISSLRVSCRASPVRAALSFPAVGRHRPVRSEPRPGPDAGADRRRQRRGSVVAPIISGTLTDSIGWQGIFCILLMLGCVLLAGCFRLRESLPAERRSAVAWGDIFRSFGTVLRNRRYAAYRPADGFRPGGRAVRLHRLPRPSSHAGTHYVFGVRIARLLRRQRRGHRQCAAFSIPLPQPEQKHRAGCMGRNPLHCATRKPWP